MRNLEDRIGMIVPEGYNSEIPIIRLTLDPVNVSQVDHSSLTHQPLTIRQRGVLRCCMRCVASEIGIASYIQRICEQR